MNISQRIIWELDRQGKKQKDLSAFAGISTSAISAWNKNNSQPASDKLSLIADFLEVSLDYLITGQEECKRPKLHRYRWNFVENTEADKFYNKVCYTLYMLHGKIKASAMLSAIALSSDKASEIEDDALRWLAYKSGTEITLFTTHNFETNKSDLETIRSYVFECDRLSDNVPHTVEEWEETRAKYPEMAKWDENYAYLFNLAVEESTNSEYITEIFEEFSRYPNDHADLMAYIRQGISAFEDAREKRLSRRNDTMNAQKEETA